MSELIFRRLENARIARALGLVILQIDRAAKPLNLADRLALDRAVAKHAAFRIAHATLHLH